MCKRMLGTFQHQVVTVRGRRSVGACVVVASFVVVEEDEVAGV